MSVDGVKATCKNCGLVNYRRSERYCPICGTERDIDPAKKKNDAHW